MAAYKIEPGGAPLGCPTCGNQTSGWDIIDPDGIAGDTTYMRQEDAEEMVERLNEAYEKGLREGAGRVIGMKPV